MNHHFFDTIEYEYSSNTSLLHVSGLLNVRVSRTQCEVELFPKQAQIKFLCNAIGLRMIGAEPILTLKNEIVAYSHIETPKPVDHNMQQASWCNKLNLPPNAPLFVAQTKKTCCIVAPHVYYDMQSNAAFVLVSSQDHYFTMYFEKDTFAFMRDGQVLYSMDAKQAADAFYDYRQGVPSITLLRAQQLSKTTRQEHLKFFAAMQDYMVKLSHWQSTKKYRTLSARMTHQNPPEPL